MSDFGITEKSRPLVVTAYQPQWVDDFRQIATRIRDLVGNTAVRIDHIGSTAVPALAAKDVIDIQISLPALDSACGVTNPLRKAGFRRGTAFQYDVFHSRPETDPELRKLVMVEPERERRTHIHIRELGRFNQRFALLFRDYLRSSENIRAEYETPRRAALPGEH